MTETPLKWTKQYDESIAGGQPGHVAYVSGAYRIDSTEAGGWMLRTADDFTLIATLPTLRDCKARANEENSR